MKTDEEFMMVCLDSAEKAYKHGEMPFGCVIIKDNNILVKSENSVVRNRDVTEHAEIMAMREAQKILASSDLSSCDIYCSVEPCAMCSFMIRELRFKKVVFSLLSPVEGGYSKYGILQDRELNSSFPHHFGPVPEIVSGTLVYRAKEVWEERAEMKRMRDVER